MKNEIYQALLGARFGRFWWARAHWKVVGQPAQVAFDPDVVLKRDEEESDVIGFYHTHPHSPPNPSNTDENTMETWVFCLGKSLACLIRHRKRLRAYWFFDDENGETHYQRTWVKRLGPYYIGVYPDVAK